MAGNRRNLSMLWPFAPTEIRLNRDTHFLKLIAMLTMFCDHAGKMLFPQYPVLRLIGRIAFPIYAYCLAVGCVYTKNPLNYLKRFLLLALIVQPIYAVSMAHTNSAMFSVSFAEQPLQAVLNFYLNCWKKPSILVALSAGMILIWSLRNKQLVITAAMLMLCWLLRNKLDYGFKGIMLMLLFYVFISRRWLSLPVVLAFMLWWAYGIGNYSFFGYRFSSQVFAVCALPFIYVQTNTGIKLPKWLFYAFYPAHFALIFVLDKFVF